ncbi:hypothetical protein [Agromyces sp. Marseille-P2726]|uniref:hypothetical protein n=1 Tax=Agromyces sp. Marseille-P2726 TaxID=2709132 RepID=UPI00156FA50D|nr:hypothetical protein [Agromyces sp. Marseille-P2726]
MRDAAGARLGAAPGRSNPSRAAGAALALHSAAGGRVAARSASTGLPRIARDAALGVMRMPGTELLALQRAGGNAATARVVASAHRFVDGMTPPVVARQATLTIPPELTLRPATPANPNMSMAPWATAPASGTSGAGTASTPRPAPVGADGMPLPDRYSSLLRPALDEADSNRLRQATGGSELVAMIERRDAARRSLADMEARARTPGGDQGGLFEEYDRAHSYEAQLTQQIQARLAKLGVADEAALLRLVNEEFPRMFLREARLVADGMLTANEQQARAEQERYSQNVCSPDIDGLFDADRTLAELDPHPVELSIRVAEDAMRRFAPAAGVPTPEEFEAMIPEHERSVLVDIANLEKNRKLAPQRRAVYDAARFGFGRDYPILLHSTYRPGMFSMASYEQLSEVVRGPVTEILENITRVRRAIADDELKVWNLRNVLQITLQRLGVEDPVLIGAVQRRIAEIESDETFLSWVKVALAIVTSVVAGLVFTPAAGMAVAAAWGVGNLAGSITEYRNETAAENVALEESEADISLKEPTLTWVMIDALTLGLELGPLARAIRPSARALAALRSPEALVAFRARAAAVVGDDAAAELSRKAATRFGVTGEAAASADTAAAGAAGDVAKADELARFHKPSVTGDVSKQAGTGGTNRYGDYWYSTQGTVTEQNLAKYHEQVHSILSPKLLAFREFRASVRMTLYQKSFIMRGLEEALAETVAQLRVRGLKGLPTGLMFPINNGYLTVSTLGQAAQFGGEIVLGTIIVSGYTYTVYWIATRDTSSGED